MGIRFLDLSVDQRTQEVGTKLLAQINMQAAINTAQMERVNVWSIASDKKQALLKQQLEADKKSVDTLATELEYVKQEQTRARSKSKMAHLEAKRLQELAQLKHKRFRKSQMRT